VIGVVRSPFTSLEGMPLQSVAAQGVRGEIELHPRHQAALKDLDGFSHLGVISHLHRSEPPTDPVVLPFLDDVERGLFATRSPRHPNPIGVSVVRLLTIEDATLHVEGLDLLDGTPVLDHKPYVPLFDCVDAERIGWLTHKAETVHTVRADRRFDPAQLPSTEEELHLLPHRPTPAGRADRRGDRRELDRSRTASPSPPERPRRHPDQPEDAAS
jgi:tRNA-Thr(GGU) m(6)t(6)A37 methyltransferase TsaA